MKRVLFKGVGTAIATPFDSNGVNLDAFKKLLQFQLSNSVDAIIVCGTTGESSTMTDDERVSVIKTCIDFVDKRVPVIVGTGSICKRAELMHETDMGYVEIKSAGRIARQKFPLKTVMNQSRPIWLSSARLMS